MCVLGDDELVDVLRWLPQEQRLGSCSLVSTQFRRAATAATTGRIAVRAGVLSSSSFQQWLHHHGHAVKGIEVLQRTLDDWQQDLPVAMLQLLPDLSSLLLGDGITVRDSFWQHLPDFTGLTQLSVGVHDSTSVDVFTFALPRLQHLRKLSLTAQHALISSSEASVFSQLTALQQLSLACDTLEPVALQQLTQLEDLHLSASRFTGAHGQDSAVLGLLSQLPHLTQLQLSSDSNITAGSGAAGCTGFAAITTSSRLQHLKLHLPLPSSAAWQEVLSSAAQLPELLTFEAFASPYHPLQISSGGLSCTPSLAQLTSLQELRLCHCELEADVLSSLTQLTHLALLSATFIAPRQRTGSTEALLSSFANLQQLRHLNLVTDRIGEDLLRLQTGAAYTALVASSKLQSLRVICQLQSDAWNHAFLLCHDLSSLTRLDTLLDYHQGYCVCGCETPLNAVGVAAMCSRCRDLRVGRFAVQPGASLEPLRQLQELTHLELAGVSSGMLRQLAGLQQLRHLSLGCDSSVSVRDMLQLTTLTCLTQLWSDRPKWLLLHKVGRNSPTIASQLVTECAMSTISAWPDVVGILVRAAVGQLLAVLCFMFGKLLKAFGR